MILWNIIKNMIALSVTFSASENILYFNALTLSQRWGLEPNLVERWVTFAAGVIQQAQ